MAAEQQISPRRALLFEVFAVASSLAVAGALSGDKRATAAHGASVWVAVGFTSTPLALSLLRKRGSVAMDITFAIATLSAIGGSYTIGGIVLVIPAFLLVVAGTLHYLSTPSGARSMGLERGRPQLVGAAILAPAGAVLGLSLSPVALAGYILSGASIGLLGSTLADRRRRRGKKTAVAWAGAVAAILVLNVLAWMLALTPVASF